MIFEDYNELDSETMFLTEDKLLVSDVVICSLLYLTSKTLELLGHQSMLVQICFVNL